MLGYIFNWTVLWWVLLLFYIPACIGLIVVVLLQKGKGVGFAGAFGVGGGTEAVFGPRSSRSLPQKLTYTSAAIFMTLALLLSLLSGKVGKGAAPELLADDPAIESAVGIQELFDEAPAGVPPSEVPPPQQPLVLFGPEEDPAAAPPVPPGSAPIRIEEAPQTTLDEVVVEETPEAAVVEETVPEAPAEEPAPAPVQ